MVLICSNIFIHLSNLNVVLIELPILFFYKPFDWIVGRRELIFDADGAKNAD